MDYERICSQEGYRREDLNEADRRTLDDIDYVIEALKNIDVYTDIEDIDEETIEGKLKGELFTKAMEAAIEAAQLAQYEVQIGMAEAE